jgi:hypothetical protein
LETLDRSPVSILLDVYSPEAYSVPAKLRCYSSQFGRVAFCQRAIGAYKQENSRG